MARFLIAFELYKGNEFDYKPLYDQLAAWGAVRGDSTWDVELDMTVMQVVDALHPYVHPDADKVVALKVYKKSDVATRSVLENCVQWLKKHAPAWLSRPTNL